MNIDPKTNTSKEKLRSALGLYRSMVRSGEKESDHTNEMLDAAMLVVNSLDTDAMEAMEAVDVINGDLESHYNDLGYNERPKDIQQPTPHLAFGYTGTVCWVTFGEWGVWDNQNDDREWSEDGNTVEPLEPFIRKQIAARLAVLREMPF